MLAVLQKEENGVGRGNESSTGQIRTPRPCSMPPLPCPTPVSFKSRTPHFTFSTLPVSPESMVQDVETASILERMRVFYSRLNPSKADEVELIWKNLKKQYGVCAAAELNKILRDKYGCDLGTGDDEQLEIVKQTHPEHLVKKDQGIMKVQRSATEAVTTIQTPNDKKVGKAHLGKNLPALQLEIDQLKQKLALSVKERDLARQDKGACVAKSKNLEKELRSWLHDLEQVCADSKESEKKIRKQQVYIQELKAELHAFRQNIT